MTIRKGTAAELAQGSEIFQSPFWASMKQINRWESRIYCWNDCHAFLVLIRRFPCFTIAYLPGIDDTCLPGDPEELSLALKELASILDIRVSLIRIDARMLAKTISLEHTGLRRPKSMVQPADTVIISLTGNPRERYHTRVKRALKKAHASKIRIHAAQTLGERRELFPLWHELYAQTARRDGFAVRSREYLEAMASYTGDDVSMTLWAAYMGEELCAGAMTAAMNGKARYLYGCSSREGLAQGAMYLLQDRIITELAQTGHASYDLFGIGPEGDDDHHLASLTRFKLGFGGERVSFTGTLDYPVGKFRYLFYRMLEDYRFSSRRCLTESRKRSPRS